MPYNFVTNGFLTKKLCSRFSSRKVLFLTKTAILRFWALNGKVRCSSSAHWKACSWVAISYHLTFLLGVIAEALQAKIDRKLA